jgi:hypothetical protein
MGLTVLSGESSLTLSVSLSSSFYIYDIYMSSAVVVLAYSLHTALLASASFPVVLAHFFCCKTFKSSVS